MHSKPADHNNSYIFLIFLVIVVAGWFLWGRNFFAKQTPQAPVITATYDCDDSKSITARYSGEIVDLDLSDTRSIVLNHAMSADGARYANRDESFVFWNKGNTAFITEGNKTTFTNCVAK